MSLKLAFALFSLLGLMTTIVDASELPYVTADDGTYLGELSCYGSKALGNRFGSYGSHFNSSSIWNQFGTYGSKFNSNSPYNLYTSTPPKLFFPDDTYMYLTANRFKTPRMSPQQLESFLIEKCNLGDSLRSE